MTFDSLTIGEALRLSKELQSPTAQLDVEYLLSHAIDKDALFLRMNPDRALDKAQQERFQAMIEQRKEGRPVAHLIGSRGFWTLDLAVNESTLIPRPDTECLVEKVLECFGDQPLALLDLGTGTGAIALALASERPNWRVVATDKSEEALSLARRNAEMNKLAQIEFRSGNWFEAIEAGQRFDVIVSNPPYIDEDDPHLDTGDVRFEPRSALVAPDNGLADLEKILEGARAYLNQGGRVFLEHGFDQAEKVQALYKKFGYEQIVSFRDYGGNDRFSVGVYLGNE